MKDEYEWLLKQGKNFEIYDVEFELSERSCQQSPGEDRTNTIKVSKKNRLSKVLMYPMLLYSSLVTISFFWGALTHDWVPWEKAITAPRFFFGGL